MLKCAVLYSDYIFKKIAYFYQIDININVKHFDIESQCENDILHKDNYDYNEI